MRDAADQVLKQLGYTVGQDVLAQAAKEVLQYVNAQGVQSTLAAGAPVAFLYDLHGNTRAMADDAQAAIQRFAYEAFGVQLNGALLNAASSTLTTLLYSGEHTNPVSGLQFLRARFYDPAGGRFRVDPLGGFVDKPKTYNAYLYGSSNGVYHTDPSGQIPPAIAALLIPIIGYAVFAWGTAFIADGLTDFATIPIRYHHKYKSPNNRSGLWAGFYYGASATNGIAGAGIGWARAWSWPGQTYHIQGDVISYRVGAGIGVSVEAGLFLAVSAYSVEDYGNDVSGGYTAIVNPGAGFAI